ncbi:putative periplasmic protein [uncultured Pleomorphomonas sp.]|uniref:Putative periplasmic protein n=2 Tax=uncultured Pleomorphomonas sp. TaxID=442121 RepID=A0A212LD79_9HYPH|nr:putative periplasmic protein [uncultured Pleomorphomonas sp.]
MIKIATLTRTVLCFSAMLAAQTGWAAEKLMSIHGVAAPPVGYVQFCATYPADCRPQKDIDQVVTLTQAVWSQLNQVNTAVNTAVLPATDMEIYGVLERWDYPKLAGDCEDYVLEKRRDLIQSGWPQSALLITVVRDETGSGHAVLTVRTNRGDVVLDNKTDKILVWADTPYTYLKRQSTRDPNSWDLIEDARTSLVGSLK